MNHERLWAPWRLAYIKAGDPSAAAQDARPAAALPGADESCFLCRGVVDTAGRENLVVGRGSHSVVVINRYPYNNGHLLVAPRLHKAGLSELTAAEQLDIQGQITRYVNLLQQKMNAEGF